MNIEEKIKQKEQEITSAQKELIQLREEQKRVLFEPLEEMIDKCYIKMYDTQTICLKIIDVTNKDYFKCLCLTYGQYYSHPDMCFVSIEHKNIYINDLINDYKKITNENFNIHLRNAKAFVKRNFTIEG